MEHLLRLELNAEFGDESIDKYLVRWNTDDTHIAVACSDGSVKIYTRSGQLVRSLNCRFSVELKSVTSISWRPHIQESKTKNILLATTADGGVIH